MGTVSQSSLERTTEIRGLGIAIPRMQTHPQTHEAQAGYPAPIHPILKWPGGKTQILPMLRKLLPAGNRLVEPFLGGASVFLGTEYPSYLLLDAHADLISMYKQMVQRPKRIIELARPLFSEHAANEAIYLV
ncbi:DNA adenine methylase [Cupriavidus necator]